MNTREDPGMAEEDPLKAPGHAGAGPRGDGS